MPTRLTPAPSTPAPLSRHARTPVEFLADAKAALAPEMEALIAHPLYAAIRSPADLAVFLEHHVYAVWDFMSLLKALQRAGTCVEVPWVPVGHPATRRFINEIVLGEESDIVQGTVVSHFELYLTAMQEADVGIDGITRFVAGVRDGQPVHLALENAGAPPAARAFVMATMDVVRQNRPHAIAAAFCFGREQGIPLMFLQLVRQLHLAFPDRYRTLVAYLERHIEVDGDDHGPLAEQLLTQLCEADAGRWQEAVAAAIAAIQARLRLWDGVLGRVEDRG